MFQSRFITLFTCSILLHLSNAYDLGQDVPICWKTNMDTSEKVQLPECPKGIYMDWNELLPEIMHADEDYPTSFRVYINESMGFHPVPIKKSDGEWEISHANIHSCLQKVGFCTPFVANSPGLATHTAELRGNLNDPVGDQSITDFNSIVNLQQDSYTVIAHARIFLFDDVINTTEPFKYDVAIAQRRSVLGAETLNDIPEAIKKGMLALCILSVVAISVMMMMTVIFRNEKVVKFSQPQFMLFFMFFGIITCLGTLTLGYYEVTDSICQMRPLVTIVPLVVMFSFLGSKTYRVIKLMNNKTMKRATESTLRVYLRAFAVSGFYLVIVLIQLSSDAPVAVKEFATDLINYRMICKSPANDSTWTTIAGIYIAVLMIIGVYMANITSKYVVLFNEGKYIAFAIQNMAFLAVVIVPSAAAVKAEPGPVYMLYTLGIILAVLVAVGSLMLPKFKMVLSGAEFTIKSAASSTKDDNTALRDQILKGILPTALLEKIEVLYAVQGEMLNRYKAGIAVNENDVFNLNDKILDLGGTLKAATTVKKAGIGSSFVKSVSSRAYSSKVEPMGSRIASEIPE